MGSVCETICPNCDMAAKMLESSTKRYLLTNVFVYFHAYVTSPLGSKSFPLFSVASQTSMDCRLFAEVDDTEFRPSESELDEYHPKATRTLFVGNLEKDTTVSDLVEIFKEYGEVIVSFT